jgi:putative spermidine/putrescine transport system permease protein
VIEAGQRPGDVADRGRGGGGGQSQMRHSRLMAFALVVPALSVILLLFVYPLLYSMVGAFEVEGGFGLGNFERSFELYRRDVVFTFLIVGLSTVLIGVFSIAIGGYLVLGGNPTAVAILRWLYRWPLFIPFIVAGQLMRTFLAKNGLMNNTLVELGLLTPMQTLSFLDWRGIVITFVWKQLPFATLLVAGAMAALDRAGIEAAQNMGAGRLRILVGIVLPQVARNVMVALVLSCVTMMSVLSVPLMISGQSPTMLTVAMAWRINSLGDYGTANALGLIACIASGIVAWAWLRQSARDAAR